MNETRDLALSYLKSGLCVLPIRPDGSKAPAVNAWACFQERLPTSDEINDWLAAERGIALVCGSVSGNLETLDFETQIVFDQWAELVQEQLPSLLSVLVINSTPGKYRDAADRLIPGRHVRYRVQDFRVPRNTRLARNENGETIIETRGEGGYALAPGGSPQAHHSGEPYVMIQGNLADLPQISARDRATLISAARALNKYVAPERLFVPREPGEEDGGRPGDRFNLRADWSFLKEDGWTLVCQAHGWATWRRPGKTSPGISATTGYCRGRNGTELLYVFSTNAHPFEAERCYSPFAAYAFLKHDGDFEAAARELADQPGPGATTTVPVTTEVGEEGEFSAIAVSGSRAVSTDMPGVAKFVWPEIVALSTLPPPVPFPAHVFPDPVSGFVYELAEALGVPPDFPAQSVLAVAASAIGNTRSLAVKEGYYESARLFALLVGGVGSAKTAAINIPADPLRRLHGQWKEQYDRQKEEYDRDLEEHELLRKKAHQKGEACPKSPPHKPVLRRSVVENFTIEKLAVILSENPRGTALVKDELTGWLRAMNSYRSGRGEDRQFFLSCFSGEMVMVDRKAHPDGLPLHVPHPFLTILGGIQPSLLCRLSEGGGEDGLVERFLYTYPAETPLREFSESGVSQAARHNWLAFCQRLTLLDMTTAEGHGRVPVACGFTPAGKEAWKHEYNRLLIHPTHNEDFPQALKTYWAKLRIYAARLALVLELMHNACIPAPERAPCVSELTAIRTAKLLEYYQASFRRVQGKLIEDPVAAQSVRILAWLTKRRPERIKRYELYQDLKKNQLFPTIASLDPPLQRLCEHNYLRPVEERYSGRGRPAATIFEVHPAISSGTYPDNPENPEKSSLEAA